MLDLHIFEEQIVETGHPRPQHFRKNSVGGIVDFIFSLLSKFSDRSLFFE
jgi:hypothetical protein